MNLKFTAACNEYMIRVGQVDRLGRLGMGVRWRFVSSSVWISGYRMKIMNGEMILTCILLKSARML